MKRTYRVTEGVTISRKSARVLLTFWEDVRDHDDLRAEYQPVFRELRAALRSAVRPKAKKGAGQ